MLKDYKYTIIACFVGYISQAIVNNFVPLLFVLFQTSFSISLEQLGLLTGLNFFVQLCIDLLAAKYVDRIGYRASIVMAHICCALGFWLLTILPNVLSPFMGLCIAVGVYAIGGGLIEVLISPIMEACPNKEKDKAMSLLHSFYCWGHVGVVLCSTVFFGFIGIQHWRILAFGWSFIPLCNAYIFCKVPISSLQSEGEVGMSISSLFKKSLFWILLILMVCAGACEQAISQWTSTYAELTLHLPKEIGDLAGPLFFATMMGLSRLFYGKKGEKISLYRFMLMSAMLCFVSYLMVGLNLIPLVGLVGCGLAGLSVGILWPGAFSLASKYMPHGGTAMFALFALGGDVGCALGPSFVGTAASLFGQQLSLGILCAIIFPTVLIIMLIILSRSLKHAKISIS